MMNDGVSIGRIRLSLEEAQVALNRLISNDLVLRRVSEAALIILQTLEHGGHIFACGNGGSMCDAMHFAEELTGRYRTNRKGLSAIAICDPAHITCVANDFGYENIFSRYLECNGRSGDCLLAISTSGSSRNVVNAAEMANSSSIRVISLTGKPDSELEAISEVCICTPAGRYADRVQELHIKILHILIELVEAALPDAEHSDGNKALCYLLQERAILSGA